ncbi:hypothetical protein Nepgr_022248 [Nepenthes gracilis]|uniref:Response regulatory domain-containing protein n=1 Tax=Nepenthes gracilis TaxID=150966 RepID=A0AAD3T0K1_NEPGR|nr:hypothetical protein Nepgr_022248 [Nepenthes gracilis]
MAPTTTTTEGGLTRLNTRASQGREDGINGGRHATRRPSGLVVDSEPVSRLIHTAVLHACGVAAQDVETGVQVLELFASGTRFDIVVLDVSFSGMRPFETTRMLRAMDGQAMLIGITANDFETDRPAFLQAGGDELFAKPLTAAKLRRFLGEHGN